MRLFKTLKSSIHDPVFYRSIRERKTSSSFGYFALLILVASLISSTKPVADIAGFIFQPSEKKDALRKEILSLYPDELSIRFENGTVSTNVAEPFAIPLPYSLGKETGGHQEYPKNLLVIDTTKPISSGDFETFDTIAILGRDSIGFHDPEERKTEIRGIGEMSGESFSLDKGRFVSFVGIAERFAKGFGVAFLFLLPIVVFTAKLAGFLLYLLFGALVIWIVAKARGTDWRYGESYKAGLHLMTLPILYGILSSAPFVPALHIPFLFTAILAIATAINLARLPEPQKPTVPETDSSEPIAS
ncbi:MAG: DUF1189 family protein [Candidatus Moranbacteria bacterium]|nr:DUF1189 family protein [Candidatus Moranbacteria bacterium]